ncbi:hypothetical protein QWZ10_15145 [Paracoccus cavernae]|uniref:ABM domain-containing protein n=1 Tax=Paracoccus cavernae TaxID=1571207 RepID=A0ABT8D7N6_9RHOB|nr:hypothetical protein [Paracoccus cavernae]
MTQAMPQKKSGFAQRKGGAALQSEAIRIVEGGGFGHRSEQLLSPDDRLVSITRWRGKPEQREDRQLRAGAYLAARRHIEANPIPAGSLGEGRCATITAATSSRSARCITRPIAPPRRWPA